MYYQWAPYVSVAERRAKAKRELAKRKKRGEKIEPVVIEGRTIARTFWGKAWCDHMEGHCDFDNRLPRGRTYVRNGSVVHLAIGEGRIDALVQGSSMYEVKLEIVALPKARWTSVVEVCSGQIDSLVELLQGKLSDGVMRVVTHPVEGLFPTTRQLSMRCSCPDGAVMCKHVAATLYGVGARLDEAPDLLFRLRRVDPTDLIAKSVAKRRPSTKAAKGKKVLADNQLADVFGIDIDDGGQSSAPKSAEPAKPVKKARPTPKPAKRAR
jgi:uncharacterized Zn finger protein